MLFRSTSVCLFSVTVTVTTTVAVTAFESMLKISCLVPLGIVSVAGSMTAALSAVRLTVVSLPTALLSVRTPKALSPPDIIVGSISKVPKDFALRVRFALFVVASGAVAIISTVLVACTPNVVTLNDPEDFPSGMVMLAGTVARVVSEVLRVTSVPPVGAFVASVTIAVEAVPPNTVSGLSEIARMLGYHRNKW